MQKKQVEQKITKARAQVEAVIRASGQGGGISAALAGEGYDGGYRDALDDMLLLLNDVTPQRRNYWQ